MDFETAQSLAQDLEQLQDINYAQVVHFEDPGHPSWDSLERTKEQHGNLPSDGKYGIDFSTYDALITQNVINAVSEYKCGGIYCSPDIGTVVP
jgi:hypothetical protein